MNRTKSWKVALVSIAILYTLIFILWLTGCVLTTDESFGDSTPTITVTTEKTPNMSEKTEIPVISPLESTPGPLKHEHRYVESVINPTCEENGWIYAECECGAKYQDVVYATNHDWSEWHVKHPVTCTKNGVDVRTCTRCPKMESREVAAIEHAYEYSSTKKPTTTEDGYELYSCIRCRIERKVKLPALSAIDVDMCGESLLGKVLPNAPYPDFTEKMFDRWTRELSHKESYAEGLIRFPGVFQYSWTPIGEWEMPYRYITSPFPYTAYKNDDYYDFLCWGYEKEYENQRAVYQRVAEILEELGIDEKITKKEAILRINNWICDYKYYQNSDEWGHGDTHYSLFRQDGVCHNYALAFQVLCLGAGIECHYYSSTEMNHAWNKVYFSDNTYLWVDCTWNDGAKSNRYLLISTEQLLKTHKM